MSDSSVLSNVKGSRWLLFFSGLLAVAFGVIILIWPGKSATALAGVIALYVLLAGIIYIPYGIFAKGLGIGSRIALILLGVLAIFAGITAFGALSETAVFLGLFLTIMIAVLWIIEGFTALFTLGQATSKLLTILYGLLSIIAGFILLFSPVWGLEFLWWFFAIALIVLGAVNALRAIFGKN